MSKALTNEQRVMVDAALSEYGAGLTATNFIAKGGKTLAIKITTQKTRLRFEDENGKCRASGPIEAKSVHRFVSSFWYWERPVS